MYLIIKHEFDNTDIYEPYYYEIIGYADGEIEANCWINSERKRTNQYKGLDGCMYPYYTKKHISKLV